MRGNGPRWKFAAPPAVCAALLAAIVLPTTTNAGALVSLDTRNLPEAGTERWVLTGLYSHSGLSGGRDDWDSGTFELLYRSSPKLILGAGLDLRSREQGTDALYSGLFSYQASPTLEWHGTAAFAPDPEFSALQKYATGIEWRTEPQLSLLLDVERLNFPEGPVDQYKAGVTYWFSDRTYLTGRYVDGRAFHDETFDAVSLQFNLGLSEGRRLTFGIAHGADPEKDPAVPGVILTTADSVSLYYRTPLRPSLDLIAGVEYEDRRDIYRRSTVTVGFVRRF
jgi:YaiO family outer membrane protein